MKKRKEITYHSAEGGGPSYMGIGHSGGGAVVWAYVDGKIETWTGWKTHQDVYGKDRFNYWRGRYEGFTGRVSIVPPSDINFKSPPRWLIDKLEAEFGADFEIHAFNPPRRERNEIQERSRETWQRIHKDWTDYGSEGCQGVPRSG